MPGSQKIKWTRTEQLAKEASFPDSQLPREIIPLTREKWWMMLFLLIDAVAIFFIMDQFFKATISRPLFIYLIVLLVLFALIPIFIFIHLYRSVEIKKISPEGVFTHDFKLPWDQLADSLIIKVPRGKAFQTFLILITCENLLLKFDLRAFSISDHKLACLIENFKSNFQG